MYMYLCTCMYLSGGVCVLHTYIYALYVYRLFFIDKIMFDKNR